MNALAKLTAKWAARRDEWKALGVAVNGAALADQVIADLREIQASDADIVTLAEAHALGGYSVDHLQRLVSNGKIENMGRRGSPRIRRSDVPIRPGHTLPTSPPDSHFSSRRRMALAVTTSQTGGD